MDYYDEVTDMTVDDFDAARERLKRKHPHYQANHRITISPGDAYGDPQLWCTVCDPTWLGPVVTGMTLGEAVQALRDANMTHTEDTR